MIPASVVSAIRDACAVLLPVDCAGCGAPDRALCDACCGRLAAVSPQRVELDGLTVCAAHRYEGVVRRSILQFKESSRSDIARPLARPLRAAIEQAAALAGGPLELCPVPRGGASWRRRGVDPLALLLARSGLPRGGPLLREARAHASQKSLGQRERASNLLGAFIAGQQLDGRRLLLIDDVVTTGATILEAKRAAEAAGASVAGAAVLAATPRRVNTRLTLS